MAHFRITSQMTTVVNSANALPPRTSATPPPSRAIRVSVAVVAVALIVMGRLPALRPHPGGPQRPRFQRVPQQPASVVDMLVALGLGSVSWYACALAIIPFWWLAVRWPLQEMRLRRAALVQGVCVALAIALTAIVHFYVSYRGAPLAPPFLAFVPVALAADAIPLLAVAALANLLEARRRAMRDAMEAQRLRAELAESRLSAVTMQLQPHFLFNTLQSISTLIHRDPAGADAMLGKLSELLRDVLRRSRTALVPLSDELRMAVSYLDLAKIRYGDRLRVLMDVDDRARSTMVPVLLLQPLLENALHHGVGPRAAGGCVGVTVKRDRDEVTIEVWDDGVGLDGESRGGGGVGLNNTRERLRHAFGMRQQLELSTREGGGVVVAIRMPFTESRPSAP